jgi:hypothetical protein
MDLQRPIVSEPGAELQNPIISEPCAQPNLCANDFTILKHKLSRNKLDQSKTCWMFYCESKCVLMDFNCIFLLLIFSGLGKWVSYNETMNSFEMKRYAAMHAITDFSKIPPGRKKRISSNNEVQKKMSANASDQRDSDQPKKTKKRNEKALNQSNAIEKNAIEEFDELDDDSYYVADNDMTPMITRSHGHKKKKKS